MGPAERSTAAGNGVWAALLWWVATLAVDGCCSALGHRCCWFRVSFAVAIASIKRAAADAIANIERAAHPQGSALWAMAKDAERVAQLG